jgi:hypothetical protein
VAFRLDGAAPQPAIRIEHKDADTNANPCPRIRDFPERIPLSIENASIL